MVIVLLYLTAAADNDATTPCLEGFLHPSIAVDESTRREVWSLDIVSKTSSVNVPMVVNECYAGVNRFPEVMRSHICGHPDSDTSSSID